MLLRSSYAGEAVRVNELVRIHVLEVHDKKVKLGLEAPEYVTLIWEKRAGQRLRTHPVAVEGG